jgi:hypothetical protein
LERGDLSPLSFSSVLENPSGDNTRTAKLESNIDTEAGMSEKNALRLRRKPDRRHGIALVMALAILAISISLVYAVSRASATQFKGSVHEGAAVRANVAARMAAAIALEKLANDPNWLPRSGSIDGKLPTGEPFHVDVKITDHGRGRLIAARANVLADDDQRSIAEQLVTIRLAKQRLNNFPTSPITSYAPPESSFPGVYLGKGTSLVGNIKSKGKVQVQNGLDWNYNAKKNNTPKEPIQNQTTKSKRNTGSQGYQSYHTRWGSTYSAESLGKYGMLSGSVLTLSNVSLGPTATNPMGVYIHTGDLVLDDNVSITGTLVVTGRISISGTNVQLAGLTQATDTSTGTVYQTTFPTVVADGSVTFQMSADFVRISGLLVADGDTVRLIEKPGTGVALGWQGAPGIKKKIARLAKRVTVSDTTVDAFTSANGPAIYIKGAIMANHVTLLNDDMAPLALVFDAARTDTTDAPGFFTWKATEWTEAN